jgi:MFS family permease
MLIFGLLVLGTLSMSLLQPVLPLYLTSIGVIPSILGLMFSTRMIGMAIGEAFWGWATDRVGPRLPLILGAFICGAAIFSFTLTQTVPLVFIVLFFWGSVSTAYFPIGRGYIGVTTPVARKATVMGIFAVVMAASRSLGALPSGFIVDTQGYNTVFLISAGIALLGGVVAAVGLQRIGLSTTRPTATHPHKDDLPPSAQGLSYRPLVIQGTIAFLNFFSMGLMMTFLPLLATQVVGVGATEVGILFTIQGLVVVILGIPLGMLADRKGKRLFMILGLLASAAGLAGIAFAQSYSWLIAFIIIRSLGMPLFNPAAVALLSDSVPPQRQSTIMGLYGTSEIAGSIAGSAIGGFIWSAWGPPATFLMGTGGAILGAIMCLSLPRGNPGNQ